MSDFTSLDSPSSEVSSKVDDFIDGIPSMSPDEFIKKYGNQFDYKKSDYWADLVGNILSFGATGRARRDEGQKMYDFNLQKYFKNIDIKLANTEIQRRVKDAIAAGVNPIYALGAHGAGDANGGVNGSTQEGQKSNNLLKLMMLLFGLVKLTS